MNHFSESAAGGTRHYVGSRGAQYLDHFDSAMAFNAEMALAHFSPHLGAGDRVVDFGCGNGELLSRLDVADKVGVEVNEHARKAAAARGVRTVSSSDEVPDGWADVIVSHHAMEHTVDPYAQLVGLRRALKPDGRLVLVLPIDDWRVQRRVIDEPNHHLYTWTPLLLGNLLTEAGYEVVQCRVMTRAAPPRYWWQIYRALPRPVFAAFSTALAIGLRRRQLMAVAKKTDAA